MRSLIQGLLLLAAISICAGFLSKSPDKSPAPPLDWQSVTVETVPFGATSPEIKAALGEPMDAAKCPPWSQVTWSRKSGVCRLWGHHLEHDGHLISRAQALSKGFARPSGPDGWQCRRDELLWMFGPSAFRTHEAYLSERSERYSWTQRSAITFHAIIEGDKMERTFLYGLEWPCAGPDELCVYRSPYDSSGRRREAPRL